MNSGGGTSMAWKHLDQLRRYIGSSLWVVPFVAIPFELVATRLAHRLDAWLGWPFLSVAFPGAQATLQAIVTATLSFIVFTFGSLLVAIQVASAQMTPRIIATTLLRDNVVKYTVGLFIFTLLFALSAQNRMDKEVHQLVLFVTALLGVSCFAAFFYLIDYASRLLRPISILTRVGNRGLAVIKSVYPDMSFGSHEPQGQHPALGLPDRVIQHEGRSEIILAVYLKTLVDQGEGVDGSIEFVPQVVILLRSTNLSSICTAEPQSLMTARYARRYYADPSARWSKTPLLHFASSSILRSRPFRPRSTTRQQLC